MRYHHLPRQFGFLGWKTPGRPTFDATKIRVGTQPVYCRGGIQYPASATLVRDPDAEVEQPVAGWQTVTWPFVALTALRRVLRGRVDYEATATESEVEVRLVGATTQKVWSGTAWVTATSTWNAPAQVEAGLPSWPERGLGLAVRMRTVDGLASPVFVGLTVHLEMELSRVSSNVLLPSGWFDDAIYRGLIPLFNAGLSVWFDTELTSFAQTQAGKFNLVDLTAGVGTQKVTVTEIGAVYNVTDDATRTTPLPGVATASTFTLTTPIVVGKRLAIRYKANPDIVTGGDPDEDLYVERMPTMVLDGFRARERVQGVGRSVVIDEVAELAYVIDAPTIEDLGFTLAAIAESNGEVADVIEAACEVIGRTGRRMVSAGTGIGYDVLEVGALEFGRRGDLHEASIGLLLQGVQRWDTAERSVPYMVEPSVGDVTLDAWQRT